MANRLRLVTIVALSFLTSAALAQCQSTSFAGPGLPGGLTQKSYQSLGIDHAYPEQVNAGDPLAVSFPASSGSSDAGAYRFQNASSQQGDAPQAGNGTEGQSQSPGGTQTQNGNQSQKQNPNNQGQGKEEAPPEKPHYLTYTPKKKTLQEEAKSGKSLAVDFKSVPAGAEVTVDGYFVGHTPTTSKIPLGKHLVSITKWGYRSWQQELDVTDGGPLNVNPTLNKDW